MLSEILFSCPNCEKQFTLDEWLKHDKNQEQMNLYIKEKFSEEKSSLTKEFDEQMNQKLSLAKSIDSQAHNKQINELKLAHQKREKELELKLTQKEAEIIASQKAEVQKIDLEKAKISDQFSNQIAELKLALQKEQNQAKTLATQKNTEIKQIQDQQLLALEHQKNELQTKINERDAELRKNKENQQHLIDLAKAEVANKFNDQISQLNLALQNNKNELNALLQQKEAEINQLKQKQLTDLEQQKNQLIENHTLELNRLKDQKNQLEIKNAEKRILQNKIVGENWENEVENELIKAFGVLNDKVEKTTKSIDATKPDYLQIIRDHNKNEIGRIVYEVKNAEWSDRWIPKLVEDAGKQKTKYGILVTNKFSEKNHMDVGFRQSDDYDNIWITDPFSFIFVAQIVRKLIEIEYSFNQQKRELTNTSHEELLKKYTETVDALKNYMLSELPSFIKNFETQMTNLTAVETALTKNANKITKVRDNLTKAFNKKIKEKLEKISNQKVLLEDNEETVDVDLNSEEVNSSEMI